MIKIDEIYHYLFWPYIQKHVPATRMFYCDPFGSSRPENLVKVAANGFELNYTYFHDQEPIYLDMHAPLFDDLQIRNRDLNHRIGPRHRAMIHSEYQSDNVRELCERYRLKDYYYFFHGWAALDWFRGYDRTWLITDPNKRDITHSFFSANRIVGGRREHRVRLLLKLLEHNVHNACISFPDQCPVEGQSVLDLAHALGGDQARELVRQAQLPWNFSGETGHPMKSYCLTQFHETASSLAYVITETVFSGTRQHLTEKTFKPICLKMPFVMVSCAGSLEYLRRYGFHTFHDVWDESYDSEVDDAVRLSKISQLLCWMDSLDHQQLNDMYQRCLPVIEHNHRHFYGGGFERVLWDEVSCMLEKMRRDFND
jgi:hypothetical protein